MVLAREKERLSGAAEEAAAAAQALGEVAAAVEHCGGADVPMGELQAAYTQLQRRYPEEFVMYNLPAAALAQVTPRLNCASISRLLPAKRFVLELGALKR